MSQIDTNTDNTAAEKSLLQLATDERMANGWGPVTRSAYVGDPDSKLTAEERDEAGRRERQKYTITAEVRNAFGSVTQSSVRPQRLLAFPEALASDEVLGSNVAMRVLLGAADASERHVSEFVTVLRDRTRIPPAHLLIQKLNGRSYLGQNTTLAEAFWLCEMVQWFQCLTPMFGNVLAKVMTDGKELVKIEDIDFTRKLTDSILRDAMDQQYSVLEQLLRRI